MKENIRFDLKIIADLIKPNSSVLDIGCGDGELLQYLRQNKNVDARGVEVSQAQVSKALMRGLSVIHGDAENDLRFYPDQSFDYAVLSQVIQATNRPDLILQEMLRIAKFAIVSLPNFAQVKNRLHLAFKGTMPVNKFIPYQWYETPNVHFCSIKDFEILCKKLNLKIKQEIFLCKDHMINRFFANLFAEYGVFLVEKNQLQASAQEEFALEQKTIFGQKTAPQPI